MTRIRVWLPALLGGVAVGVLVGGWVGPVSAVAVTVGLGLWLRRMEPRAVRRERARAAAHLPFAADLLASALRSGASVELATRVVGESLAGPLGRRLVGVARALRIGLPPGEAWSRLGDVPGADRLLRAAVRSSDSGAALTGTLDRLADDLRVDRRAAADAAVHRVAVLAVLPLGMCFLPAFVLTGVVPVVISVLGETLR